MTDNEGNEAGNAPATKPVRKKRGKKTGKAAAQAFAKAQVEALKAREKAVEIADTRAHLYYVACTHWHPGIFLTGQGHGLVGPTEWFSSYKDVDQVWPSTDIKCQVCGEKVLVKWARDGKFVPYARFVKKMNRAKFEEMTEGDSDE